MITIAVIDGQGGGIGRAVTEKCKKRLPDCFIIAAGTNATATASMVKAGADVGATGENAIIYNAEHCDILIAPIGAAFANSMYGEITEKMAMAVSKSEAVRVFIPISKCAVHIAGLLDKPLADLIDDAVSLAVDMIEKE